MITKGCRAVIKCPQNPTVSFQSNALFKEANKKEEQVYQITFPNEQTAQAAKNAMRPYFNIGATIPVNNAGIKRPRPQSQSQPQDQIRRAAPPPHYPVPPTYDFGQSDIPPSGHTYHPSQAPLQYPYPTYPPTQGYQGLPTPLSSTGEVIIPPTMPVPRTSPPVPTQTQTAPPPLPIPQTPAESIREPSPPPAEESEPVETQFLETQYSTPKGSSSSSCDKPSNAQIQKSSPNLESDETLEDIPKMDTSTAVKGDLLSMDDDEIRYSPGLAAHPALDPYEGMPWSSNMGLNGQDRVVRSPHYPRSGF